MQSLKKWLFPSSIAEAIASQKEMADQVILKDDFTPSFSRVAGVDVSNHRFDPEKKIFAAALLFSYPTLSILETATNMSKQAFPYIPGLLGFREAPLLVQTLNQLRERPDMIMVDGHGISHPRGLGIASHLGLLLDIPTIGVAKSILVGSPEGPLGEEAGSTAALVWKGKKIAMLLRTKRRCTPLIISQGHKVSSESALQLVIKCLKGYRLPETTRHAHLAANACRKSN